MVGGDVAVSFEHMVELTKQLEADAWFCVPWNADNTYIEKFAQFLYDEFPTTQKIYLQYSFNLGYNSLISTGTNNIKKEFT